MQREFKKYRTAQELIPTCLVLTKIRKVYIIRLNDQIPLDKDVFEMKM